MNLRVFPWLKFFLGLVGSVSFCVLPRLKLFSEFAKTASAKEQSVCFWGLLFYLAKTHNNEQRAFRLRDGFMLFTAIDMKDPVQLTVVNFKRLTQLPIVPFDGWKEIKASDKKLLLPILNTPPVSNFLKLDPETSYGHLSNPGVVEVFSAAA